MRRRLPRSELAFPSGLASEGLGVEPGTDLKWTAGQLGQGFWPRDKGGGFSVSFPGPRRIKQYIHICTFMCEPKQTSKQANKMQTSRQASKQAGNQKTNTTHMVAFVHICVYTHVYTHTTYEDPGNVCNASVAG